MDKVMLLLFAVFAVFQVQAAPELYHRLSQDQALRELFYELGNQPRERVSNDLFDEPAMSRERLMDDLYSSELRRRDDCTDKINPLTCERFADYCEWQASQFHQSKNYLTFQTTCCYTCKRRQKK